MKKIGLTIIALTCFVVFGIGSAIAFEQQGIAKGNTEVAVYTNYYKIEPDQGESTSFATIGGSVGYFLMDPLEVGGQIQISYSDTGNEDSTPYTIRPFAKYHFFAAPTIVPYVGVAIAYYEPDVDGADSELGYNLNGGANFFFKENLSLSPEIAYDIYDDFDVYSFLLQLKAYF